MGFGSTSVPAPPGGSRRPAPPPRTAAPASPAAAPPAASKAAPAVISQAAATGAAADLTSKLQGLGLTGEQVNGVLALSREVIEKVVWEVVPDLAETMIREEIKRLTAD